jgi:hypothetical protein
MDPNTAIKIFPTVKPILVTTKETLAGVMLSSVKVTGEVSKLA